MATHNPELKKASDVLDRNLDASREVLKNPAKVLKQPGSEPQRQISDREKEEKSRLKSIIEAETKELDRAASRQRYLLLMLCFIAVMTFVGNLWLRHGAVVEPATKHY